MNAVFRVIAYPVKKTVLYHTSLVLLILIAERDIAFLSLINPVLARGRPSFEYSFYRHLSNRNSNHYY